MNYRYYREGFLKREWSTHITKKCECVYACKKLYLRCNGCMFGVSVGVSVLFFNIQYICVLRSKSIDAALNKKCSLFGDHE